MQKRVYIGIDWGHEKHAICVTDEDGKVLKERFVPNDATALQVIAELTAGTDPGAILVGVETRRIAIVEALMARSYRVFSINPRQSDRFRDRFNPAGAKDDRRDAKVLASSLRTDLVCFDEVQAESAAQARLRTAARASDVLQQEKRAMANRLREVVLRAMPVLLELCPGADEPWFWDLIVRAMHPDAARTIGDDDVALILKANRIRRLKVADVRVVLDKPHLPTAAGVCDGALWEARMLIEPLRLFAKQEKEMEREVQAALAALPKEGGRSDAELIKTAPGFADKTTAVLLVEGHQALVRGNLPQLRALAGVAPVTQGSGRRQAQGKMLVVMRRATSKRLRNALHHAADAARRDPRFGVIYTRLRTGGASHARALRGVADRLLKVVFAMLRNRTEYGRPTPA